MKRTIAKSLFSAKNKQLNFHLGIKSFLYLVRMSELHVRQQDKNVFVENHLNEAKKHLKSNDYFRAIELFTELAVDASLRPEFFIGRW